MPIIKTILKGLPSSPGVYKMKDKEERIIYVGKAKNLKHRVSEYFQKDYSHSTRTRKLLESACNIEYIETDTELEAILLENNLIKELRPRYNILMKDDKSYVYIKVDMSEDFPRIRLVREREIKGHEKDKNVRYFGPKLASSKVYETLRILKKLFPFRHCNLNIKWEGGSRVEVTNKVIDFPCIDYHIKRCPGPCIGAISPEEYKKIVQQILDFLSGKSDELEKSLKAQMNEAASQKLFEKAARIRDKLLAINEVSERQKITDPERQDTDVINFKVDFGHIYFNVFMVRGGKLINCENFVLDALDIKATETALEEKEVLESFLIQYYEKAADIPKEVLIPEELEDKETFEKWLGASILFPKRGEKNRLLELSLKNAVSFSKQYKVRWMAEQRGETALKRLAEVLKMNEESEQSEQNKQSNLKRIEGYDISHLGGDETVGSMVVFENGFPKSEHYRHFKMRTVKGKPDDYRSMEEVLMRRLKYLANKKDAFLFKKPSKKVFEDIKKNIKKNKLDKSDLDPKNFICLYSEKKFLGFGRIRKLSEIAGEIGSLWIDPEKRGNRLGYELIKRIMQKSKFKKFYVYIKPILENYYAEFGFRTVKEIPEIFKKRVAQAAENCYSGGILMVMEKRNLPCADPSFSTKPDLIVVDGGKGQLSTASLVLKRLKLEIPVISLAKRLEEIFIPGEKAPLLLEEGDEALKLLQRIRDESHRFAITFQRELHLKSMLHGT